MIQPTHNLVLFIKTLLGINNSSEIEWANVFRGKTENKQGSANYCVVKLNSSGVIEWQNTIGGNQTDYLMSLEQSSDGGYILGGYSVSGASGYKTEDNIGSYTDIWLVKLQVESCAVPTGIETNTITQTKATVFWDMNVWASNYKVYYRTVGALSLIKKNTPNNIIQLKLLTPGTNYQYKVRTKCENLIFSEFSPIQNFTTLPLRENCMNERSFINVFPNPAAEEITLTTEFNFTIASIVIIDLMGKNVLYQNIYNNETTINIKDIPSGIHFTLDGITSTQKFIIQ